jgi:hypothetical protein
LVALWIYIVAADAADEALIRHISEEWLLLVPQLSERIQDDTEYDLQEQDVEEYEERKVESVEVPIVFLLRIQIVEYVTHAASIA